MSQLRARPFAVVGDYSPHIECAVCLEPWADPVELLPCQHIYCRPCVERCWQCPRCRVDVAARAEPSPVIRAIGDRVAVECLRCAWRGTRGDEAQHAAVCGSASPATRPGGDNASSSATSERCGRRTTVLRGDKKPVTAVHADPRRPWLTYNLGPSEYERAAAAFRHVAASQQHQCNTNIKGESETGAHHEIIIRTVPDFKAVLERSGLFPPGTLSDRDVHIFYDAADVNRDHELTEHLVLDFVGLNRPVPTRPARSYRRRADDEDGDEDDGEDRVSRLTALVAPPPPVAALPTFDAPTVDAMPRFGIGPVAGVADLSPHITAAYH